MVGYKAKPTPLMFEDEDGQRTASALIEFGGWDYNAKKLTPIRVGALAAKPGAPVLNWLFDSIAAAAEAGTLDTDDLAGQIFGESNDFEVFIELMREGSDLWWLNDRYFWALQDLGFSEEDCTSFDALADAFERDFEFAE